MATITEWLASLGLSEYAKRFTENDIDVSVLRHLTDQDLKELGVSLGHRRKMLAANWTTDAKYLDPLMSGDGHDGVDALIAGVQQRFPDFSFRLIGEPNGFGDHVRFSWGLGPDGVDSPIKGTDFAVLKDGRIRSITGFLNQIPPSA